MSKTRTTLLALSLALLAPTAGASATPSSPRVEATVAARAAHHAARQQDEALRRGLDLRRSPDAREREATPPANPPPAEAHTR